METSTDTKLHYNYGARSNSHVKQKEPAFYNSEQFWRKIIIRFCIVFVYYTIGAIFYTNVEGWSIVQSLYFITCSITTVGFGDFAPTTPGSRAFSIMYIIIGIAFIMSLIGIYATKIINHYQEKMIRDARSLSMKFDLKKEADENHHLKSPHITKVLLSCCIMIAAVIVGAIFFWQREDWDFGSAVYFCFVTSITVGYGDMILTNDETRGFAIFYIIVSVCVVTLAVGQISKVFLDIKSEKKKLDHLEGGLTIEYFDKIIKADTNGDRRISKLEFFTYMMVMINGLDREKDINPWLRKFDDMDKTRDGFIDSEDLQAWIEEESHASKKVALLIRESHSIKVSYICEDIRMIFITEPLNLIKLGIESLGNRMGWASVAPYSGVDDVSAVGGKDVNTWSRGQMEEEEGGGKGCKTETETKGDYDGGGRIDGVDDSSKKYRNDLQMEDKGTGTVVEGLANDKKNLHDV